MIENIRAETLDLAFKEAMKKEAIAFHDWCDAGNAYFFDNNEEYTHTTEQLYILFKEQQQQHG